MQEHASTCEMQQETHGTAAFRVRRASGQRATSGMLEALCSTTSAQHGTDATQDATYDPCRSLHQTQTEPTTRSRQCNVRDETNEIRTLAHLGARFAGGGGVGLIVGLGLPEIDVTVESCNSQNWAFGHGGTDPAKSDVPNSQDQVMQGESETEASETSGGRRSEGA
jgi:hypothetical protein